MSEDAQNGKKPNVSNEVRNAILQALLRRAKHHKLEMGAISETAAAFQLSTKTISRIWQRAKECFENGQNFADVSSKINGNSGRKKKCREEMTAKIAEVPLRRRGTIRGLSHATGIPVGTLFNLMKENGLKRVTSTVKPVLTEENKKERLRFALSMLCGESNVFQTLYDFVHVDEKWFYMTKIKSNYYLLPEEDVPHRTVKSKRFIAKVMFLAAVARPRYDPQKKKQFDGKIGIWPFVVQEPAKRNSKNREKGTMVTKPIEVTKAVYVEMITKNVIPAIKAKWPVGSKSMNIKIQQDNARPHAKVDDQLIVSAGMSDGWSITMTCQPPNSPDFNVLDLGFFNAIQALQHQEAPRTIEELIQAVQKAFEDMPAEKLDNVFLSLQKAMECTMKAGGNNDYALAHIGKDKLRAEGKLPVSLTCGQEAVENAQNRLNSE